MRDVLIELSARRSRTLLMLAAVALSTGALIASVGVSTTAAHQINSDLAASTLNEVTVTLGPDATTDPLPARGQTSPTTRAAGAPTQAFPPDTHTLATHITGVAAAGRRLDLTDLGPDIVSSAVAPRAAPGDQAPTNITLAGVTPGYLAAAGTHTQTGRAWALGTTDPVVFLGTHAAHVLSIPVTTNPTGYAIDVNDTPYQVAGFLTGTGTSNTALIPYTRALDLYGSDATTELLIRTRPGAGAGVASVATTALRPDAPNALAASQVENLSSLRRGVSNQLGRLGAWIGAFLLALTALLIANAMVVSVIARTTEIGLRRALGSSRRSVSAVFWSEGAITGLLGGLAGSAFALLMTTTVAAANNWTAHINPWLIPAGPALGAIIGTAASAYPALRAGHISPALAIRAD